MQKDLVPVAHIADFQFGVSVKADSPIRGIADLVPVVKKSPQIGSFGSPAPGSLPHFFGVMIGQKTGLDLTHVPYNGGAQLMTALIGDQVTLGIDTLVDQGEMHRASKSRILATSGANRNALFPDVPTLRESGFKDLVGVGWFALFAPGGTDAVQINLLNAAVNRALKNPALKDRLTKMGLEVGGGSPEDLENLISAEMLRWAPVVKASGFTADCDTVKRPSGFDTRLAGKSGSNCPGAGLTQMAGALIEPQTASMPMPIDSKLASELKGPSICMPTGMPSAVSPAGMDTLGMPALVQGSVLRMHVPNVSLPVSSTPPTVKLNVLEPLTGSILGAAKIVVGNITASTPCAAK